MSAETDFRTALLAETTLAALVGSRVAQNGVEEGSALPYIVFTTTHEPILNLLGDQLGDRIEFTVECWATRALVADQVADAVTLALRTRAPALAASATVTGRGSGFDGDLGLDATVLAVEWWA